MRALTYFVRGFAAAAAPVVLAIGRGAAVVGIFVALVYAIGIFFDVPGLPAFWFGVVAFISLGGILGLAAFIRRCIEIGTGPDENPPDMTIQHASSGNVVRMPTRMSYRKVE